MVATGLGSLHHRHPLVVVAEEGQVQVRTAAVGLSTDGQLTQQPTHSLRVAAILGIHDGVFEPAGRGPQFSTLQTKPLITLLLLTAPVGLATLVLWVLLLFQTSGYIILKSCTLSFNYTLSSLLHPDQA